MTTPTGRTSTRTPPSPSYRGWPVRRRHPMSHSPVSHHPGPVSHHPSSSTTASWVTTRTGSRSCRGGRCPRPRDTPPVPSCGRSSGDRRSTRRTQMKPRGCGGPAGFGSSATRRARRSSGATGARPRRSPGRWSDATATGVSCGAGRTSSRGTRATPSCARRGRLSCSPPRREADGSVTGPPPGGSGCTSSTCARR